MTQIYFGVLIFSQIRSKTGLREKKKREGGRIFLTKGHLFQILIMTPINFGPLFFWQILNVDTQGFQNQQKWEGPKMWVREKN